MIDEESAWVVLIGMFIAVGVICRLVGLVLKSLWRRSTGPLAVKGRNPVPFNPQDRDTWQNADGLRYTYCGKNKCWYLEP